MRIARDGYLFAVPLLAAGLLSLLTAWYWLSVPLLGMALFVLFFFRDPDRLIPSEPEAIVSPADGKVIRVTPEESGTRVAIFLSVFNVHVNRAPVAGTIEECEHQAGRFYLAYDDRASLENEQVRFRIGSIRFALIAGLVARRIIPWKQRGAQVEKGDRIALIRFGSRADILVPADATVIVSVGDRVRAGSSVIARWSQVK